MNDTINRINAIITEELGEATANTLYARLDTDGTTILLCDFNNCEPLEDTWTEDSVRTDVAIWIASFTN